MTPAEFQAKLASAYPKAFDFSDAEYQANAAAFDVVAATAGYRYVGTRAGAAVFSTKPAPVAPPVPPVVDDGSGNYEAMILRRADALRAAGDRIGALELETTLIAGWPGT